MTGHAPQGPVPAIDSAANTTSGQVIGNKSDTEAGDSIAARLVVPTQDQANNDWVSDVVGNKTDTVAGGSLVSRVLQAIAAIATVDGYHDIPGVDAAANATIRDVLGGKADTVAGNSAMALLQQLLAALAIVDGYHDVPAQDSKQRSAVVGIGLVAEDVANQGVTVEEHIHTASLVLPNLGNAVQATSAAGVWAAYGGVATFKAHYHLY